MNRDELDIIFLLECPLMMCIIKSLLKKKTQWDKKI